MNNSNYSPKNGYPEQHIRFSWDIHYRCNYRCPYCWFNAEWADLAGSSLYLSPEEWIKVWNRIYNLYGEVYIDITGGEPLLYPDICQLLSQLSALHKIRVTTNLSINKEAITTLTNMLDNKRVHFDISFHPLFVTIDEFLDKAVILKEGGFCSHIQFVAYPPQFKMLSFYANKVKQSGLSLGLTAFWGTHNNKCYPLNYDSNEKNILREYIVDIDRIAFNVEMVSSGGKMCYAGNRFVSIKGNGDVVPCGRSKRDEKIGNLLDEDFTLNDKPIPCPHDYCPCNDLYYEN